MSAVRVRRRFAPRPWAVIVYLLVLGIMLALGRWQLVRADEKIALLASAERARALPAVAIGSIADIELAVREHRRVQLVGRWEPTRQMLWDNRAHRGVAGFEVITPLRGDDGRLVLVNRGWVAPGASRQREAWPDVALPEVAVTGPVEIEGLLSRPSKGFASGPALPPEGPWPRLLQYFDYAAIEAAIGEPIVSAVVQTRIAADDSAFAEPPSTMSPVVAESGTGDDPALDPGVAPTSPRPELLIPNWRPAASGPEKHYGYAFQWFAMASALTVIFIVLNLRARETPTP